MRVNVTVLPIIVAAVLMGAAFITRSEPAPEQARSYFATLVGRELVWGTNHVPDAGQKVGEFIYGVPRIATQLEGDLSPIGAVFQEQDFPAFALKPTPAPTVRTPLPALSTNIEAALAQCRQNPERYNWKAYALAAGFPADVVNGEMEYVVQNESGGDLCARNASSGAICWIQQISGEAKYLDPATCMAIGFAKWVDGGRDFYRHWYQWWN